MNIKTYEIHASIEQLKGKKFRLIKSPTTIRSNGKCVTEGSIVYIGRFGSEDFLDLCFEGTRINENNAFADWEEVKEPVTWQEAIQAWVEEHKTIRCVINDKIFVYQGGCISLRDNENRLPLTRREFLDGEWYID